MNKSYRIIWNKARKCLMVVGENAKSRGKSSSEKSIVDAVAAVLIALGGSQAYATSIDISTATTAPVILQSGDSLNVQSTGSVDTGSQTNSPAVTNSSSANIVGGIVNRGTLTSIGVSNVANAIQFNGMSISGQILNTGAILSSANGLSIANSTLAGGITNTGSIQGFSGTAYGIKFTGLYDTIGPIQNSGLIQGVSTDLTGGGSSIAGVGIGINSTTYYNSSVSNEALKNSGLIAGLGNSIAGSAARASSGYGIQIQSQEAASYFIAGSFITNTGMIYGVGGNSNGDNSQAGTGAALNIVNSRVGRNYGWAPGVIRNNGILSGAGGAATGVAAVAGNGYGINVINSQIGTIDSVHYPPDTVSGGINNLGTMQGIGGGADGSSATAGSGYGISMANNGLVFGVSNSGFIQAIGGSALGSGSSAGNAYGVSLSNSTISGTLLNAGVIQAVGGNVSGDFAIAGSAYGIVAIGNSQIYGITNTGSISGIGGNGASVTGGNNAYGISFANSTIAGSLRNTGVIQGLGGNGAVSGDGYGISFTNSTVSGSLLNAGVIQGQGGGGLLAPGEGYGVSISGSTISGALVNSGTIRGISGGAGLVSSAGVFVGPNSAISGGLSNSGLIKGDVYSIYVDPTASLPRIVLTGNNSASFSGALYAPNTSLVVADGSVYTPNINYTVSEFTNSGTLVLNPGTISTITGNFVQTTYGAMRIEGNSSVGGYGQIYVDGTASLTGAIQLNLFSAANPVVNGMTIAGVLSDSGGIVDSGLSITSNSALSSFAAVIAGNQLNIVALSTTSGVCSGVVSANTTGPCIVAYDAPSLSVNPGVTISGGAAGIQVLNGFSDGASVSGYGIRNQGVVDGYPYGIEFKAGATQTGGITNSGQISGGLVGIYMQNAKLTGGIQNSGSITGTQGMILENSSITGIIANTALISGANAGINTSQSYIEGINNSGTIVGANAFYIVNGSTINGQVINSGSIQGAANGYGGGHGFRLQNSALTGSFINTGTMNGATGLVVSSSELLGGINSSGKVEGVNSGILVTDSHIANGIRNSGTVSGNYYALNIGYSTISGGISNSGLIAGGSGLTLSNSQLSGNLSNSNTVSVSGNGVYVSGSTITGNISNSGLIFGSSGISLINSQLSGNLSNSNTVSVSGNGVYVSGSTITGNMSNSGLIAGGSGLTLSNSQLSGNLSNSNTVSVSGNGVYVSGSTITGNISNGSLISGSGGILLLSSNLSGGFINSGSITASGNAVFVDGSTIGGGFANSGLISGASLGVYIGSTTVSGSFINNGTISSGAYLGAQLNSLTSTAFINNGLIQGGSALNSESSISPDQAYAYGGGGNGLMINSTTFSEGLANFGTILGLGANATITASVMSTISGEVGMLAVTDNVQGASINNISINGGIVNGGLISALGGNASLGGSITQSSDPGSSGALMIAWARSGSALGLEMSSASSIIGGITNQGVIEARSGNVSINTVFDSGYSDVYVSTYAFSGNASGLNIQYSNVTGNINNSGQISAIAGSASAITQDPVVYSAADYIVVGGDAIGLNMHVSSVSGSVINSGLIQGIGGSAIASSSLATVQGGIGAGIVLSGQWANPDTNITGSLQNIGTIQGIGGSASGGSIANGGDGLGIRLGSGALFESSYSVSGVVQASQGITNSGLIQGIGGSATGTNAQTGLGIGLYVGLNATINGGINNSGIIQGSSYSIYVENAGIVSSGINITGSAAQLIGDVRANTADMNLKSGAIFTNTNAISVNTLNVESGATFNLNNGLSNTYGTATSGALGIAGGIQVTNGVSNSGVIAVIAGQTPTITGDYRQLSGGVYQPQLTLATSYGKLNVSGTATLDPGAVVNVNVVGAPYLSNGTTLTGVLTAGTLNAGSIAGVASNVTVVDNSALLGFIASTSANPNSLDLVANQTLSMVTAVEQNNNPAAVGAATVLQGMAASPPGAMQGVITRLYEQPTSLAVSNAISQTLPAMAGAGSLIAAQTQQSLNQIMQGRQNQLRGLSSGEEYIGNRNAWMKGFGSWANQSNLNGVSGYKVNTGGLALGIDHELSPRANIGAVFAFANSGVNSNSSAAPSGMTINTYQLGAYGDYALRHDLHANYQVDFGLNNNKEYRNLSAFNGVAGVSTGTSGVNANGNYNSYVGHLGAGLRQFFPVAEKTTLIPSVRADYTTVQSNGYSETGAGSLNLNANSQTYNMLLLSADLKVDQMLTEKLKMSANVGAGYNTLNNQVQMTTAFQGGGPAFTTNGLQISPWLYSAGLGVSGRISKDVEMNVRYDTQFTTSSYNNQMVSAKLKFYY